MPSLREGPQSPFLKRIFSQRDFEPLYVAIPSRADVEEKASLPLIVLTPSTPTDPDGPPLVYPAGRLPQPNARLYFCDEDHDDEEDLTLKPASCWSGMRIPSRTARVSALLGLIAIIVLVQYVLVHVLMPREEVATASAER